MNTRLKRKIKPKSNVKSRKEIIQYKNFRIHKLSYLIVHSKDEVFKKRNRTTVKRLLKEIRILKDSTFTVQSTGTI